MATTPHRWKGMIATLIVAILLACAQSGALAQAGNYGAFNNEGPDSTTIFLDAAKVVADATPAQALELLQRALEASIVHRNKNGEARAYLAIGQIQAKLNHPAEAKENLLKCKNLFGIGIDVNAYSNSTSNSTYSGNRPKPNAKELDPSILLEATLALTRIHEDANQWEAALQESAISLQLLQKYPAKAQQQAVLRTQARLHSKMGHPKEATTILQQLRDDSRKDKDQQGTCETLIELGDHYRRTGDNQMAKDQYEKAIAIAQALNYRDQNIRASQAMAAIYNTEGNLPKEIDLRNDVVTLSDGNDNAPSTYLQNIAIGNAYLADEQLDLAQHFVEAGIQNLTNDNHVVNGATIVNMTVAQPNSTELQVGADAYRNLAEGFRKKNELEKSLEYYKKYAVLQDSVKAVHGRELAEATELSKTLGKNEERVQLLERERSLADASIELLQQDMENKGSQILTQNLIIGALIACLALVIVAGFVVARNTRARRRADKLLALQSMTGQMNPHFIFNALNSVNEYISQNDERAANRYLTSFSRLMRKVMDDSKHTFIPLTEEVDMLQLYLELEHARFKDQFAYRFEVDQALEGADFALPPMIVQPYIENAIWHGLRYRPAGGHLHIHFQLRQDRLTITIADDGIGIAQSKAIKTAQQKKQHSMGMKNIGTRMALMNEIYALGMTVTLAETHPGAEHPGTTVTIVIPQASQGALPGTQSPA